MSFSQNEKIKLAEKALTAGLFDADPAAAWYESSNPWSIVVPANKVWTEVDLLRQNPAANLTTARTIVAGALAGVVEDRSQFASAVRLTALPGINNTYVALTTYGNFSSTRLEDWLQPQLVPQSNGSPSIGYSVRLFNGNPATTGVEVLTTDGVTGTGANKSVAWIFNYAGGILALADDFDVADPWICGFRYIGGTAADLQSSGSVAPTGLDTSTMAIGLCGYISGNSAVSLTDAGDIAKSRCAGIFDGVAGSVTITGVVSSAKFSTASPTPVAGQAVFLSRADAETSSAAAGKLTTTAPSTGAVTHVGIVLDVDGPTFTASRTCKVLLQIMPPIKRA